MKKPRYIIVTDGRTYRVMRKFLWFYVNDFTAWEFDRLEQAREFVKIREFYRTRKWKIVSTLQGNKND